MAVAGFVWGVIGMLFDKNRFETTEIRKPPDTKTHNELKKSNHPTSPTYPTSTTMLSHYVPTGPSYPIGQAPI